MTIQHQCRKRTLGRIPWLVDAKAALERSLFRNKWYTFTCDFPDERQWLRVERSATHTCVKSLWSHRPKGESIDVDSGGHLKEGSTTAGPPNKFRITFALSPTFRPQNGCNLLHPTRVSIPADSKHALSLSLTHSLSLSHTHTLSISISLSFSLPLSLSLSHTHTHSLSLSHYALPPRNTDAVRCHGGDHVDQHFKSKAETVRVTFIVPRCPARRSRENTLAQPDAATKMPLLPHVDGFVPRTQHGHLNVASR